MLQTRLLENCTLDLQPRAQVIRLVFCVLVICPSFTVKAQEKTGTAAIQQTTGSATAESTAAKKETSDGVDWYDVTSWGVEGRAFKDENRLSWFDRLPSSAKGHVTSNVWGLSRDSAGMMVRFQTDSEEIHVDYMLTKSNLAMPHMPATGVSGVDLYARDNAGHWRWVQCSRPTQQRVKAKMVSGLAPGRREYAMYLPLYNGVTMMKVGVKADSGFEGQKPRNKPIVFYGTSITHGACASRPGMVHTAILGRMFDQPVLNLGFSGNGRMHKEVGDYLVKIDAAAYVIDCLPNMRPSQVAERCEPLVHQLRSAHADVPIVLVEDRRFTNAWILPGKDQFHESNHAALRSCFETLVNAGVKNLYYITGDELYGTDSEGATDGSHANDLGFMRQAKIFRPVLEKAMKAD